MTTIEDLARILRDQPTWAEVLRPSYSPRNFWTCRASSTASSRRRENSIGKLLKENNE